MMQPARQGVSAKIAAGLEGALATRAVRGERGRTSSGVLGRGDGWSVHDVLCTSGPGDRPYEEQHTKVGIAIVVAGTFEYRNARGRALMTPGAMLLGSAGDCFECSHRHAAGDRCISFQYSPAFFEALAADAGARRADAPFMLPRLAPVREAADLVARAGAALAGADVSWEELAVRLAGRVTRLIDDRPAVAAPPTPAAVRRVTEVVRFIEASPAADLPLERLAGMAGLSLYHFLRTFERLTGLTPHRYVRRVRLREAAMRLASDRARVIDIALESGFDDLSSFNRAFRAEFGLTPREYRTPVSRKSGGR